MYKTYHPVLGEEFKAIYITTIQYTRPAASHRPFLTVALHFVLRSGLRLLKHITLELCRWDGVQNKLSFIAYLIHTNVVEVRYFAARIYV